MGQVTTGQWVAHTDVNFVIAVIGTVLTDFYAIGHELDHRTNQRNICTETCGFRAVYTQLPLDPGQRPAVFNIHDCGVVLHRGNDAGNRILE